MIRAEVTIGGLDALINAAEEVGGPEHTRAQVVETVSTVRSLYRDGFEREQSPADEGWAEPAADYGHPLMRDTRALQNDATVTPESDGVRIDVPMQYASCHQDGTDRMLARQIVPDGELGPTWDQAIGEARASVPSRLP